MRRKILLGLLPLLILLVAMSCYAVMLFSRLGSAVDIILRENYRSVVAAQNMKEAAERMDSGLVFTLAGELERGRKTYREYLPAFRQNLEVELGNITLPGERELAQRLRSLHETYATRAEDLFATEEVAARRQMYFSEMLPTFTAVKDTAQDILELNQAHMLKANRDARQIAANSTRYMIIAIVLGVGAALFLAARLQRAILQPIADVTAGANELGEGHYDQVVPVPTRDELGQLAATFNKLAGKLRAYRQVTDDRILRARQTTEATFSAFPDPIFVLDAEGRLEFSNPAGAHLLARLDPKELPGPVVSAAEQVLKGGADLLPQNFEAAICVRLDDRETFLLPRVVGMHDDAGTVFGVAVILQDVTRFRLLDEVKSNLVSTVSHELKTPLTSIRMGLHLLLEERIGALNPQQVELMLAARDDAERLLQMINDLLDLARLESGASLLALETMPAARVLDAARRDAEAQTEQGGLRVVCEVEPELPLVQVEPPKVAHAFTNFISNAVKHSRAGGEIVLRAQREGGEGVRFSVIDRGAGIPRQYQTRIFERFFRVPGTEKAGAGLGLAIAREIVVAHGGRIGVESEPGRGSEFYFVLPAAPAESPAKG